MTSFLCCMSTFLFLVLCSPVVLGADCEDSFEAKSRESQIDTSSPAKDLSEIEDTGIRVLWFEISEVKDTDINSISENIEFIVIWFEDNVE